jgi:hypothetical protein
MNQFQARIIVRRPWAIVGAAMLAVAANSVATAQTYEHNNSEPEIEVYFYPAESANGLGSIRDGAATFGQYGLPNSQGQIEYSEGDGTHVPARRGSIYVVTNAGADIPKGLAPYRYQVDSLKFSVTFNSSNLGTSITYDHTADDYGVLTTNNGEGDDAGKPIELWGVGLGGQFGDYTTFGFAGESGSQYFKEGSRRWPMSAGAITGPYQIYPIDGEGRDVENAVFGGYSATEADYHVEQFAPEPFAVGHVYDDLGVELSAGADVPAQSVFEFEPRLDDAGVLGYVQRSLAAGHLGFALSSLHLPFGHGGVVPYPRWHLDIDPEGPFTAQSGPQFELAVTILPALDGDYNHDGIVDGGDFVEWQRTVGSTGLRPGAGADGDLSGTVDAGDLAVWKEHFGDVFGGARAAAAAVPEPAGFVLVTLVAATLLSTRRDRRYQRRGGRPQGDAPCMPAA